MMKQTQSEPSTTAISGRSGGLLAVAFLLLLAAPALFAQQINRAYEIRLGVPSKHAEAGTWAVERNDHDARISRANPFVSGGNVRVRGTHVHHAKYNAHKLQRAGVYSRDGELELGAEWNFEHPIREALAAIKIELPANSGSPQSWEWADQALYELGRDAVRYVRAKQAVEGQLELYSNMLIAGSFVSRAYFNPPKMIPVIPAADAIDAATGKPFTALKRLEALLKIPEARALLILGTSDLTAALMADERDKHFSPDREEDRQHLKWANTLIDAMALLDDEIRRAVFGKTDAKGKVLEAPLKVGLPFNLQDSDRWPAADQRLLRVGGLGAIHSLQKIRSTNRAFALKADWLITQIRRAYAKKLLDDLILRSKRQELGTDYFKEGVVTLKNQNGEDRTDFLNGIKSVDDFAVLIMTTNEMREVLSVATDRQSTLAKSVNAKERIEAEHIGAALEVLKKALGRYTDKFAASDYQAMVDRSRMNPVKMGEIWSNTSGALESLRKDLALKLAEIENQRSLASRWEAKLNWFRDMIVSRDRNAGRRAFVGAAKTHAKKWGVELSRQDSELLSQFGYIWVNQAWATKNNVDFDVLLSKKMFEKIEKEGERARYKYSGDTRYEFLRDLKEEDFDSLRRDGYLESDDGAIIFYGDEGNDGSDYDFQNDVATKGLSIELPSQDNSRRTFSVTPGRTYLFSFEYMTRNMDGAKSWVNFVPLDKHGLAIGPDGRPLTESFAEGGSTNPDAGKFEAFPFADTSDRGKMRSTKFTGDTGALKDKKRRFKTAGFRLVSIPDPVAGFTIEIKIDNLLGAGEVAFRNFRLVQVENYFREGFEEPEFKTTATGAPRTNSKDPLENGVWNRISNEKRNYMPWSDISFNSVERYSGERSLEIQPRGFNVRLETNEYFDLNPDRSYIFRGRLNTKDMQGMKAWFEVMLYDEDRRPVSIDGLSTTEGNNVMRTPMRGDAESQILWKGLSAPDRWFSEEIVLDDIRETDLELPKEHKSIDQRVRRGIAFARIAIVVAGKRPSYSARVLFDDIELHESPRVRVKLLQEESAAPDSLLGDKSDLRVNPQRDFLQIQDWGENVPYRLRIGVEVNGLVPSRIGYHYTLDLYDYLGRKVKAADTIGADKLDKIVQSDDGGDIAAKDFGYINLDELDVANRFGFFIAHFRLSYKDQEKPIIERSYKIGFLPSKLRKAKTPGEFGVVMDLNSSKQRWLDRALKHMDVGRVIVPVTSETMAPSGADYGNEQFLSDYSYMMRFMPQVRRSAMIGPLPRDFEDIHASGAADGVFSDGSRDEWKGLLKKVHDRWQDRFDDFVIGDVADPSFTNFTSHAGRALNNVGAEFKKNGIDWAGRVLPITLMEGEKERTALGSLVKSFEARWGEGLDAQTQAARDDIAANLNPDDVRKLRAATPSRVWLKNKENFSFYVPASLSVDAMQASVEGYLAKIARFENILGDSAAVSLGNAQALATGGVVNFDGLRGNLADANNHSIVIDIKQVTTEKYAEQLRDLTEKIARAKELGFKRISVSRLRNTAGDELPDGLMTRGNLAQPSYYAFRTLNAVLSDRNYENIALNLKSKNRYAFFRNPDDRSLTFMLFPGEEDAVEDLPFGNDVSIVDIMGNKSPLTSTKASNGSPSGMVRLRIPTSGLPIIVTGIDNTLLDVVQSLRLDNPTLDASTTDQTRTISLTNAFTSRVTVNVSLPINTGSRDDRSISWDATLKTPDGIVSGAASKSFDFESRDIAPGATVNFPFILEPSSSMGIGERFLPVRVVVKGRNVYEFSQRIRLNVVSQLSVTETTAIDPGQNRGLELIFKVATSKPQAQTLSATLSLPDHPKVRARIYDFGLQANGDFPVPFSLPFVPKAQQEGLRIALNVRQKGGTDFLNLAYRLSVDPETRSLILVLEDDYVKP